MSRPRTTSRRGCRSRRASRRAGVHERALVEQVALVQGDAVADVLDAVELLGGGAADHAVNLVAAFEQHLGEIRAVLPGHAGYECGSAVAHGREPIDPA